MADLSVWYQPIAGGWVKLGTQSGGGRGVFPESISLEGDRSEGGCLSAQFKLKQDPRWINTEMQPYTPIAIWDGAEPIWSGRTIMSPTTFGEDDVEVVVQCQGWWQHTKDDFTDRDWVVDDMGRWRDSRSFAGADLTTGYRQLGEVVVGDGVARIGYPYGRAMQINEFVGITIDLGSSNVARRLVMDWSSSNNDAGTTCYAVAHPTDNTVSGANAAFTFPLNATGATPIAGTFPTPYRYVSVFIYRNAGITPSADIWVRISKLQIFTDTADESGNASVLKASTVISETLDACCPLFSPRRDKITTTALSLPNFPGSPGQRYANELIEQANAPHGFITRLTPDPVPVFEYFPIPTGYRFAVGEGEYTLIEPASQDGQYVYSGVVSEFEDAAGARSYAEADTPASGAAWTQSTIQLVDQTGAPANYTALIGATIDQAHTAVYNSAPDCKRIIVGTANDGASCSTFNGHIGSFGTLPVGSQLKIGSRYRIECRAKSGSGSTTAQISIDGGATYTTLATLDTTWRTFSLDFIWAGGTQEFRFKITAASGTYYLDDVIIFERSANIVERRGFRRRALRPMTHRTTLATAQAVADLELSAAQYPPFKGTIAVTGRIPLKGGGTMDASHIPGVGIGENILLKNLHDPNSQGLGRIGNISSAVYDHKTRQTMIGIDRDLKFISQIRDRLQTAQR